MYPRTPTRAHNPYAKQRHHCDGVVFICMDLILSLKDLENIQIPKYLNSTFSFAKSAIFINKNKQNYMYPNFCLFLLSCDYPVYCLKY